MHTGMTCAAVLMASGCLMMATSASPLILSDGSKPTLDGVTVCNKDHPSLKMSFSKDTVHIQSSGDIGHFDCTETYSITYGGYSPWWTGSWKPDKICGQELHARVKIHSSFEKLDFITGSHWGNQTTLKREIKDGIDHCGTFSCDNCHYDCSWPGNSLRGPQHRRRSTPPPPDPTSCTCHEESPVDTTTRRRQFPNSAAFSTPLGS